MRSADAFHWLQHESWAFVSWKNAKGVETFIHLYQTEVATLKYHRIREKDHVVSWSSGHLG